MKRLGFVLLSMFYLSTQISLALTLKGRVLDFKTRNDIVGATVTLMDIDSTFISQTIASNHWINGENEGYTSQFFLNVPNEENTTYIIKVQMMGYKPTYISYNTGKIGRNVYEKNIPDILLKEDSKLLNEVMVSATKVKFYYKGDTVVYNADAFVLAEGSMLDALVRQMPGVEMKENGDVYHNGKLVKNLLLNGKDFFKNKKVMLDNLPTYMVKNIKVYDKASDEAEFLGLDEPSLKSYVMDVCLKKEHSIGWVSNIEAGTGITDMSKRDELPYLGRLFAMRFTDHSSMSAYCNANNLNDDRQPGKNDSWKPSDLKEGIRSEQLAGLNYNVESRSRKWKLGGEFNFSHFNSSNLTNSNRVNFLTTGNTFDCIINSNANTNLHLDTSHELNRTWKYLMLRVKPTLSYSKYDNNTNMESRTSTTDSIINRYHSEGLSRGYHVSSGLSVNSTVKFENTSDYVEWRLNVSYDERKDDTFNRYSLYYGKQTVPSNHAYQYYRNLPDKNKNAEIELKWNHILGKGFVINLRYNAKIANEERSSNLYLIDKLDDYYNGEIGLLPSIIEYEQCVDRKNSYLKNYTETANVLCPKIIWHHSDKKGNWYCQADIPLTLYNQKLNYTRGMIDTTLTKTPLLFGITNGFCEWKSKDNAKRLFVSYDLKGQSPDLVYYVNMRDDTDPLNIKMGNSGLKNTFTHRLQGIFGLTSRYEHYFSVDYKYVSNAISMGYLYDEKTGIKTYMPHNVNGNYDIEGRHTFSFDMDKKKIFNLRFTTRVQHVENVDLIGSASANILKRSEVLTEKVAETITLSYKKGGNSIKLKSVVNYRDIHSSREQFKKMDVWDFDYGISATLSLPWKIQLSTDITMYSRRGYTDSSMNTNDLVWNARVSKSIMNGKLVFMFDGFDILGKLSDISWSLNGQGRTEYHRNVMPQYGMFHIQYRLNKPQKSK